MSFRTIRTINSETKCSANETYSQKLVLQSTLVVSFVRNRIYLHRITYLGFEIRENELTHLS